MASRRRKRISRTSAPSSKRAKSNLPFRILPTRGVNFGREMSLLSKAVQSGELKYVDGFHNRAAIHQLSASIADTWADTEISFSDASGVYGGPNMPFPKAGDGEMNRDGRKIFVRNVKIRGIITFSGVDAMTAGGSEPFVRVVVVGGKINAGGSTQYTCSGEDVIGVGFGKDEAAVTSGTGNAIMLMTKPLGWVQGWKVYRDFIVRPPPASAFNDGTDGALMEKSVPIKINMKVNQYWEFGGPTSNPQQGMTLLMAAYASSSAPDFSGYARTCFVG